MGFGELIDRHLVDRRQGKNTQFALADVLRQSFETELLTEGENMAGLAPINLAVQYFSIERRLPP